MKILGIVGSLRKHSYNKGLMRVAQEVAPEGVTIEMFELTDIPLFNQDLDNDVPEAVLHFKEQIRAADALLIATPEYCYSIPGVLKNAIDWASRPPADTPLKHKPAALMGAGGLYGTVRSQLAMRQVLLYNETYVMPKPELMITKSWEAFDAEGNPTDESIRERVQGVVLGLVAWTEKLNK